MARTTSTTTTPAGGTGSSTGNNLNFDKDALKGLGVALLLVIVGTVIGVCIDQAFFAEPLRNEKKELQKQLASCQSGRQEVKDSYDVCAEDLAEVKKQLTAKENECQMWQDSIAYLDSLLLRKDTLLHQKDSLLLQKDSLLQDCRKGKQNNKRKKIKQKKIVKQGAVEDKKITENVTKNVTENVIKNITENVTKNVTENVVRNTTETVNSNVGSRSQNCDTVCTTTMYIIRRRSYER